MDFQNMKVTELKSYLQERGVSCYNLKKADLIKLCENSQAVGRLEIVKTPDDYMKSVKERLTIFHNQESVEIPDVDKVTKKDWSDNLQCIPDVKWASFFVYMIDKCGWTTKQVESHEQTKGYALKVSNHIDKVKVHHLCDYELWYIRAECLRQTSQSEKPYILWVLIQNSGKIQSAGCQCTG